MADYTQILEEVCKEFRKATSDTLTESTRQEGARKCREDLISGFKAGHLSTYDRSWDFAKLFEQCVPAGIRQNVLADRGSDTLIESGIQAMSKTMFPEILGASVTIGVIELCQQAPYALASLVPVEPASPNQSEFYGFYDDVYGIVDDSEEELEETQFYGFNPPVKISTTRRGKKKFAHAITREMLAYDGVELVRQMMRNGAKRMTHHRNGKLARALFGLWPYGANPYPYIKDDIPYQVAYTGQNASPYVNAIYGNKLDGTFRPFYMLEDMMDRQVNPYTGQPMNCSYPDIIVMDGAAADLARMGLGLVKIAYDLPSGPANFLVNNVSQDPTDRVFPASAGTRVETDRQSSLQFGRVFSDRYLRQIMTQWYQDVVKLSAADAKEATHQTYAAVDLGRVIRWAQEWPQETLERTGTDTWEYFNQEIVYAIKYMEKADPVIVDPQGMIVNWPDLTQFTLTNFLAAYNSSNGTVAQISGISTAADANKFWR